MIGCRKAGPLSVFSFQEEELCSPASYVHDRSCFIYFDADEMLPHEQQDNRLLQPNDHRKAGARLGGSLPSIFALFSFLVQKISQITRFCTPPKEPCLEEDSGTGRSAPRFEPRAAAMPIFSVGVRVLDDFDALPLFDAPPLDGPTTVRTSEFLRQG